MAAVYAENDMIKYLLAHEASLNDIGRQSK